MGKFRTTIYLPDELREKLFLERDKTTMAVTEIIVMAIEKYFEEKEKKEAKGK